MSIPFFKNIALCKKIWQHKTIIMQIFRIKYKEILDKPKYREYNASVIARLIQLGA